VAGAALVVVGVEPAAAAPPPNDSIFVRRSIALNTTVTQDVSEATYDPAIDDPFDDCVAGQSVWFRLRTATTRTVRLQTTGSDYDTVLAVYRGYPRGLQLVACNDDAIGLTSAVELRATAGVTYYVAVSTCCSNDETSGGRLVLRTTPPIPPTLTTTAAGGQAGLVSGRAFVSGRTACTQLEGGVDVRVEVSQRNGAMVARGDGTARVPCRAEGTSWTVRVDSATGVAFQPGRAVVTVSGFGCGLFDCHESAPVDRVVELRGADNRLVAAAAATAAASATAASASASATKAGMVLPLR